MPSGQLRVLGDTVLRIQELLGEIAEDAGGQAATVGADVFLPGSHPHPQA